MKYIEKYKNEVIKIGDEFQATIPPFSQENQEDALIKGNILGTRLIQTIGLLIENILLKFLFSEELLWCPNLESDETEITNYLSKWQGKSEDSNIADNEEALTQLMKSNYNFEDALGKKSEKNEIPSIYHEKITEEQ